MLWRTPAPRPQPPGFIEPCIPARVEKPPVGPEWVHEIKHDGYRLIARKQGDRVRLFTRRGYDWSHKFPLIVGALRALPEPVIVLDGEAVVCGRDGVADFEKLDSGEYDDCAFLYAFDLLALRGLDYRPHPLHARKARLQRLLKKSPIGIQFNEHLTGDGATIFAHARKLGLEGVVSKHRDHPYDSGRSNSWLKVKNPHSPAMLRLIEDDG
jgi:bifunctional non-homologous end joining protein LigD